ncbi:UDP-N-acetylmuramoyl-tripeptide--D-alanyl-D-alanine ligase [Leifsonia sp. H3M29-4]|uniref:UDP-N-acetylmuramoyl-tripeptide--D-alanyl-D- alanine ligase n=1 Tax=Salinibacterium metalliresistens TaxID=3031321 RepID=UPI0023DC1812|nr:UDP-N-acetylmuramoyl-tripeptide--D-alanyl-D-alanine ligase [Salinibacterium metalliresistens]MDF1480156.1 UDP-N-acetylmuramoyl-tripeptide--D-alanyl-D-alanine ligase [Salinibacterium metalliresistens]
MIELSIGEIAAAVSGTIVRPTDAALTVSGSVHTDSRRIESGSIFFALPGEVTDGHLFAEAAVANGAALVVAERELDVDVPQVIVANGVRALADLAREVVARVRSLGELRVVGITGSNGKTSTKNMLAAILAAEGPTVAPPGSFNNDVGAPFTMLGIDERTRYLVVEMGADAVGDIARLVSIVVPDVAVVLKVGLAHIGKFGDIETIERAKAEIVTELPESAVAVLNADDSRVAAMAALTVASVLWFGLSASAQVRADEVEVTASGTSFVVVADGERTPVTLRILGEHHVSNALAAITAARALGVPVGRSVAALESMVRAERRRMEVLIAPEGYTVINDAYNASPDSMAAALKTLAQVRGDGRSFAVLGAMAELGDYSDEEHDRIGRLAVRLNVSQLVIVGHDARHIHNAAGLEGSWDGESVLVTDADAAYDVLRDQLRPGDVVLVKASNSVGLGSLGDRLAGLSE